MDDPVPEGGVVVVIDVIRAFTTAAVAFERGATEIACAASAEAGRAIRRREPDRLLIGEVGGWKPADFDLGNSPAEVSAARLAGRRLVQATSNGTVGLSRCTAPAALLAASAVNVGATARWIADHHPGVPWTLIRTGPTAEDEACARHLAALLDGATPNRADLVAGIRAGAATRDPAELTAGDVEHCCAVDRSAFAMVGAVREDHVVLTRAAILRRWDSGS